MTRVDFLASERHFVDHLAPIWLALPADMRGTFYASTTAGGWAHAQRRGDIADLVACRRHPPIPEALPIVVASWGDALAARGRPVCLVEHGAGQSYVDDDGQRSSAGYSGGEGRGMVGLFLCPSETVARRNAERYPAATAAVVGCPKLDEWHRRMPCCCAEADGQPFPEMLAPYEVAEVCDWHGAESRYCSQPEQRPVVAVSFHWDNAHWPESRSALPVFGPALVPLAERYHVIGHAHPRAVQNVRRAYRKAGVEFVEHFADVLDRADLYVCDNSSTIFEFASTDRPVVLLNAPWYRRDVEHGLRFWSHADVGCQVDRPRDLVDVVTYALTDPPAVADRRREVVADVYDACDGRAAERAAAALAEWAPRAEITEQHDHDPFRARRQPRG